MLPQLKTVVAVNAVSTTAAATTSGIIDTIGYDFATIDVVATTQAASTLAGGPSTLKLQESDSTSATTFVDIVGTRFGSATATNVDFLVPIGLTTGNAVYKFNVDCRARKRYLQVVVAPQATQVFTAIANLGRAEQSPSTAAKAGALALVEV
jgi:hypothetical protein